MMFKISVLIAIIGLMGMMLGLMFGLRDKEKIADFLFFWSFFLVFIGLILYH